jgi:hypothetical protein
MNLINIGAKRGETLGKKTGEASASTCGEGEKLRGAAILRIAGELTQNLCIYLVSN